MLPKRRAQRAVSRAVNLPAPVGGWNARDSLANMGPLDAVYMTNMVPSPTSVDVRMGYTEHATFTGQCETIFYYYGGNSQKTFAAVSNAGGKIYDITNPGAVGAAVKSGLTNARFQYTNSANTAGAFMTMVNGADKRLLYDGTTWTQDGDATHDITGVDSATFINVNLYQNRLWFAQENTLCAWYLGTQAISGAATKFDISSFCPHGGNLVALGTWTMDAGYGMNDMLAFITSNGDIVVYQGTDPSSATTWSMIGVWWLGSPIGMRPFVKFKGDLAIITQDGVIPMSSALQSSRLDPKTAISNKIQYAVSLAISEHGSNFGWQLLPFPRENLLILNVPINEGSAQQQYVMSTIQRSDGGYAWCNFTGWEANCWELVGDDIYFGSDGFVALAWNTNGDNGTNIQADCLQAFNAFGAQGAQKRFTLLRPTVLTSGSPAIDVGLNIDFNLDPPTTPLTFLATNYASWDSANWDAGIWGATLNVQNQWQGANGIGYWAAPNYSSASDGIETKWVNTTIVFESGGIL